MSFQSWPRLTVALSLSAAAFALVAYPADAGAAGAAKPPVIVLNSLDADISVVDPISFKQIKRIPTGKEPHHLYLSPDQKSLLVANALGDSLTFLDPHTAEVQRVVRGIHDPYHLRFSPDMKWLITAANRLDYVNFYSWTPADKAEPLKLVKRISAPKTPSHLAIDSKSSTLFVSLQDSNELLAVDLATQAPRWKITVGEMPADIFLTADDKHLLVALTGDAVVEVYDVSAAGTTPPKLVKRLPTGKGAHSFRAWGDHRHVLVSNRVANTISKIDTQTLTVVDQFPGPSGPDDMEVLGDGKTILVNSRWAGKLTEIDTQTKKVVRQVKVGKSPHGVFTLDSQPRQ
ncbi:YncE family protein [Paucibacter sp. B2R-40]|uniref:YncE family protein n=1 Tax=Paucibacter sp. B2R-40 TaxID=2893554 RepID=UPI0021E4F5E1|nr:YncE family protein [Paucibacter sp. B2R-40]MCV2354796.1 YncE family protein [Paucibacter sp. B2R-40]